MPLSHNLIDRYKFLSKHYKSKNVNLFENSFNTFLMILSGKVADMSSTCDPNAVENDDAHIERCPQENNSNRTIIRVGSRKSEVSFRIIFLLIFSLSSAIHAM